MKFFVAAVLAAIAGCGEQFAKKEGPKYRFAPITRTDIVKTVAGRWRRSRRWRSARR